jgi:tRNA dimethylallyltransferase
MQVNAGVETLTNQPSAAERAEVPHHLVGFLPLTETSSVGAHAPLAHAAIDAAAERGALPLVVGGTGLYLRAALAELDLPPAVGVAERARWERFYDERGAGAALGELERRDPRAASRLHANDRRRVVRALELAERGTSLAPERDRLWGSGMRRPALVAVVSWPRAELRARIAARTEAMLAGGALDEVRALRAAGIEPSPTAARILGLAQLGAHLDGDRALAEVAAEITLRTGQYARRQETWARRIPESIELAGADGPERNADRLLELIR